MRRWVMPAVFAAGLLLGGIGGSWMLSPAHAATGLPQLWAQTRGFTQDHPKEKDKTINYVPLEGGEEATFWRGTSTLQYGKARVEHPYHFALVTSEQGLTMQVTPTASCKSPVVVSKLNLDAFELQELDGKDNCDVYFMVIGTRKGHEKYDPVQAKKK